MSEALTLPIGYVPADLAGWVAWGADNYEVLPQIIDAVQDVAGAEKRPMPLWVATKRLGDVAVPVIDSSPLFMQRVVAGDAMEFIRSEQLRFGNGEVLKRFWENLPMIIQILTALKPILVG